MTWGIQERNLSTILEFHIIGTNMLGDTGNHIRVANMVEQRCLTMVNVSHHCYDRRTRNQIVLIVLLFSNGILYFS